MTNPLVSVIISAYNHEKYIGECIESIINQSYLNIELIITDDGSKDNTYKIISDYTSTCSNRFVRFIYKTQGNQGVTKTLNNMLSIAEGKYIYIIASDDIAKSNAIEVLVDALEKDVSSVVSVGDNEIIDQNSQRVSWDKYQNIVSLNTGFNTFWEFLCFKRPFLRTKQKFGSYETLIYGNYITNGYLIRKSALNKVGGYKDEAKLEDFYIFLQLSKIGSFCFINDILFSYRWHGSNQINSAKIDAYLKSTLLYEESIVSKDKNSRFYKEFIKATVTKKVIFGTRFFRVEKIKNLHTKLFVLKILNTQITIFKSKNR